MMDFLMKQRLSSLQIKIFLAEVFECAVDEIKIYSLDEFNCATEYIDDSALCCVCVFSFVQGDASLLLQIYRYKINDSNLIEKIINVSMKNKINIFIPENSFDDWIYVGDSGLKHVRQIDSDEENSFYFR